MKRKNKTMPKGKPAKPMPKKDMKKGAMMAKDKMGGKMAPPFAKKGAKSMPKKKGKLEDVTF